MLKQNLERENRQAQSETKGPSNEAFFGNKKSPLFSTPDLCFSPAFLKNSHFRSSSRFSTYSFQDAMGDSQYSFSLTTFRSLSQLPLSLSFLILPSNAVVFCCIPQSFGQACADRARLDSGWIWSDISRYQRYLYSKSCSV